MNAPFGPVISFAMVQGRLRIQNGPPRKRKGKRMSRIIASACVCLLMILVPVSARRGSPMAQLPLTTITLQPGETFTSPYPILDVTGSLNLTATFGVIPPPIDTVAPAFVSFTVTRNGKSKNYTATAVVTDNVGVQRVEFFLGTTRKATVTVAPYTTTIAVQTGGSHTFTAKAYDAAGNSSPSLPVVTR